MQCGNAGPDGLRTNITDDEIAANIARAREMKRGVCGRCLTDAELDQYFEPVDSKRTRARMAGARVRQERMR